MKTFIITLAQSRWLRIAACGAALISGADDLIEAWFGIHDLFGVDVAHGVVATAITGLLDPVGKLLEQGEKSVRVLAGEKE